MGSLISPPHPIHLNTMDSPNDAIVTLLKQAWLSLLKPPFLLPFGPTPLPLLYISSIVYQLQLSHSVLRITLSLVFRPTMPNFASLGAYVIRGCDLTHPINLSPVPFHVSFLDIHSHRVLIYVLIQNCLRLVMLNLLNWCSLPSPSPQLP